jgi:hypothetical protein
VDAEWFAWWSRRGKSADSFVNAVADWALPLAWFLFMSLALIGLLSRI